MDGFDRYATPGGMCYTCIHMGEGCEDAHPDTCARYDWDRAPLYADCTPYPEDWQDKEGANDGTGVYGRI